MTGVSPSYRSQFLPSISKFSAMKNILVPCDFSPQALEAYAFALQIAKRTGGRVTVLNAIDLPIAYSAAIGVTPYYFDPSLINDLKEEAAKQFDKLPKPPGTVTVDFQAREGPVTPVIRQFIRDHGIDLVVMGTQGASGLEDYLIGSNTEKIVRYSSVPVFAIRRSVDLDTLRNIVFPTMLEPDAALFTKIKALQAFLNAKLHLVMINTPYNLQRTDDEKKKMKAFAESRGLENYTINTRDDFGEPAGIQRFAREIKADLIAMGTHGRRGLAHFFAGSIAESVVNHPDSRDDCPIWTFSTHA
jgi:nucleotide-binding universal stress UspA family protein